MAIYKDWNRWLSSYFFNTEKAGLDVLLYISKEIIVEIGRKNDLQITDTITDDDVYCEFLEMVKGYNPYRKKDHHPRLICTRAYEVYCENDPDTRLILNETSPPPLLPYLAIFVLAEVESKDEEINDNAYYIRLRTLLGIQADIKFDDFSKMEDLWKILEHWSCITTKGNYGYFHLLNIQGKRHIKYPRSQALLLGDDKDKLPDIFYVAGFELGVLPDEGELCVAVLEYGKKVLHQRTLNLLKKGDYVLKGRCMELFLQEFEEWDGNPGSDESSNQKVSMVRSRSNIRLSLDIVGNTISFYLRLFENDEFPSGGYFLDMGGKKTICCRRNNPRWSTRISVANDEPYQASFDWRKDSSFSDSTNGYKAKFKGKNIFVFLKGEKECLPSNEWIEVNSLGRDDEFILLVHHDKSEEVWRWLEYANKRERLAYQGVPDGWTIFFGKNPSVEQKPPAGLTIEKSISMVFEGGIKVARKPVTHLYIENSTHFIPKIHLRNIPPGVCVLALYDNKSHQLQEIETCVLKLPDSLPCDKVIRIEVQDENNQILKSKTIQFRKPHLAAEWENVPHRNSCGEKEQGLQQYASGAIVNGISALSEIRTANIHQRIQRWAPNESAKHTLGMKPGQINDKPLQDDGWKGDAIWGITQNTACFLQNEDFLKNEFDIKHDSLDSKGKNEQANIELWKKALIECENKEIYPNLRAVKELFNKYITFAKSLNNE